LVHSHIGPPRPQPSIDDAHFHEWVLPDGVTWTLFYRKGADYLLRFPDLADFEVSADGTGVSCWPTPGTDEATVEHMLVNQVLPLALSRQGRLVFHASAVALADGAVAFMGASGRGKSTLTAGFAQGGFRFLTDDGLQLDECEDGYLVRPSHPSIRLWKDSQEALVGDRATLGAPVQYTSKARILADDSLSFCPEAQTLRAVYFLGEGGAQSTTFRHLSARETFIELVKNSFLLDIEARDLITAHFDRLSRMVRLPIYYRLDYPRRFELLAGVRQAILKHLDVNLRSACDDSRSE
jgi:hypothetical protein